MSLLTTFMFLALLGKVTLAHTSSEDFDKAVRELLIIYTIYIVLASGFWWACIEYRNMDLFDCASRVGSACILVLLVRAFTRAR